MTGHWQPPKDARCAKCGEQPPGEGGILCPACKQAIEARVYPWRNTPPATAPKETI
jgi:hypothetical protein